MTAYSRLHSNQGLGVLHGPAMIQVWSIWVTIGVSCSAGIDRQNTGQLTIGLLHSR